MKGKIFRTQKSGLANTMAVNYVKYFPERPYKPVIIRNVEFWVVLFSVYGLLGHTMAKDLSECLDCLVLRTIKPWISAVGRKDTLKKCYLHVYASHRPAERQFLSFRQKLNEGSLKKFLSAEIPNLPKEAVSD